MGLLLKSIWKQQPCIEFLGPLGWSMFHCCCTGCNGCQFASAYNSRYWLSSLAMRSNPLAMRSSYLRNCLSPMGVPRCCAARSQEILAGRIQKSLFCCGSCPLEHFAPLKVRSSLTQKSLKTQICHLAWGPNGGMSFWRWDKTEIRFHSLPVCILLSCFPTFNNF